MSQKAEGDPESFPKGPGTLAMRLGPRMVPLDALLPHPLNSNVMSPDLQAKLRAHIKRTGRYPFLVVRSHPEESGKYQVLDGHHRVAVLRDLGHTEARCEDGPFPLKVYTYKGTPADDKIAALIADTDQTKTVEMQLHGLFTYDYFTIVQAVQDSSRHWLSASKLQDYKEIPRPLSLVVFGQAPE